MPTEARLPTSSSPLSVTTEPTATALPKNFLRPCVLLLLREQPAHGYDLLERLELSASRAKTPAVSTAPFARSRRAVWSALRGSAPAEVPTGAPTS